MWSGRILLKYTLIQLPGIVILFLVLVWIQQWIEIPSWLKWGLIGLWVSKDVILYPFVWRSYEWGSSEDKDPMIGQNGIVQDRLDPLGHVFVRGEIWNARVAEDGLTIEKGQNVRVLKSRGLTLLVEPVAERSIGTFQGRRPQSR